MDLNHNKKLALSLVFLILSVLFITFAFIPIYKIFCRFTGYGGTVKSSNPFLGITGKKQVVVEFDSNVDKNLLLNFIPKQRKVNIKTGENVLVFYESQNLSNKDIVGIATYNVSPHKVAKYFIKIHCFCFEEQLLKANTTVIMPVSFFIDPKFDKDPEMRDINHITLSYTFYKAKSV